MGEKISKEYHRREGDPTGSRFMHERYSANGTTKKIVWSALGGLFTILLAVTGVGLTWERERINDELRDIRSRAVAAETKANAHDAPIAVIQNQLSSLVTISKDIKESQDRTERAVRDLQLQQQQQQRRN